MKATFLLAALLLAGIASAQTSNEAPGPGPGRHESAAEHMNNLATLLDLTDTQKTQVQAILEQEHAQAKAAFEQAKASGQKPSLQEMKAQHQQLEQETISKLTPVLSPGQLKKFQVLMQERHPMMGPHRGPPPDSAPN